MSSSADAVATSLAPEQERLPAAEAVPIAPEVVPILPAAVPSVWPRCRPLVDAALKRGDGECVADDVAERCARGQALLWMVVDPRYGLRGVVVTEPVVYPRKRTLNLWIVSGDHLAAWRPAAEAAIAAHALTLGFSELEASGPAGWGRLGRETGWRPVRTVYRREVG
jgi:hypothetical protein